MIRRLLSACLPLVLVACETAPPPGTPEAAVFAEKKRLEARAAEVERAIDEAPDWFVNPPRAEHASYAAGTATSSDMQLAVDKAVLNAKRSLADSINGLLSSKMKEFVNESGAAGDPAVTRESERVTTNLVTETNVAGYNRAQTKVLPQGGQFRAYVLLEYPIGAANRLMMERIKGSQVLETRLRASKAFEDLEKEIQDARSRRQ